MNKTITINLANTVFHIDEDAYEVLRVYLESIRQSFADTEGREEILADIEARIAELFGVRTTAERQVITMKEVEEVIRTMGQPEDYHLDEDLFTEGTADNAGSESSDKEDSSSRRSRKLYRDLEQHYIGGVSKGLSYYLGIDTVWIRLIFIVLTVFGQGFGLLLYLILWILVPQARTTAEKLDMRGEPVNISNIEKKVKEGFEQVADSVKKVDYQKMGDTFRGGSQRFFNGLTEVLTFLFTLLVKFAGLILVIVGGATLIALFFSLFSIGVMDWIDFPGVDLLDVFETADLPMWVLALLIFLAAGIPFYLILYLGLRLLISTLKSMGWIAKITLLVIWLASCGFLVVLSLKHSAEYAIVERVTQYRRLDFDPSDTLRIRFNKKPVPTWDHRIEFNGFLMGENLEGEAQIFSDNISLNLKPSPGDSLGVEFQRQARGSRRAEARQRAEQIEYGLDWEAGQLSMDQFFATASRNKMRDQSLELTLLVPAGTLIWLESNAYNRLGYQTGFASGKTRAHFGTHLWQMKEDGTLQCMDCVSGSSEEESVPEKTVRYPEGSNDSIDEPNSPPPPPVAMFWNGCIDCLWC